MSKFVAVDVALLPDTAVMEDLIGFIHYDSNSPILLNTSNCLPHVTLAMGVIDETAIARLGEALARFMEEATTVKLVGTGTNSYVADNGKHLSEVTVGLTDELLDFRTRLVAAIRPMFTDIPPTTDMFFDPSHVEQITTKWVLKFGETFRPHVTLGEGQVKPLDLSLIFYPDKLAICQLGNYCTCRKIL